MNAEQIRLGCGYLAALNLGCDPGKRVVDVRSLERFISEAIHAHACAGVDIGDEIRMWKRDLMRGDRYSCERVRGDLPFLFE